MSTANTTNFGLPGERNGGNRSLRREVPCKGGVIGIYFASRGGYLVVFPTPLTTGSKMINLPSALDVKLIIMDYLSKEDGRSETKQVPFPDYPGR